jgi:hypothetical protein
VAAAVAASVGSVRDMICVSGTCTPEDPSTRQNRHRHTGTHARKPTTPFLAPTCTPAPGDARMSSSCGGCCGVVVIMVGAAPCVGMLGFTTTFLRICLKAK